VHLPIRWETLRQSWTLYKLGGHCVVNPSLEGKECSRTRVIGLELVVCM
jgi:hypothetical protein